MIGDLAGSFLKGVAGNAVEKLIQFLAGWVIQILTEILNFVGTWWLSIGAPSMGEGSATERIRTSTVVFVGMAGVIGTVFALIKIAREQDRNSSENLVMGIVRTILVTAIAIPMVALLFSATDQLAPWLVRTISGSAQEDGLGKTMGLETLAGGGMTLELAGIVLAIVPLALLGAILNAVIVIFSYGMAIALCGILPIFAAASQTERGRKSFDKAVGWLAAVVLFKPAAAILYGAGLALLKGINGTAENDLGNTMISLITGLVVILSASIAMPALAKVLVPAVSSGPAGMGASGLAMLGGAVALGAVTAGVGAAGVAAAGSAGTAGTAAATEAASTAGTAGTAGTTGAVLTDGASSTPALTGGTTAAGPGGAGPGGTPGGTGSSGGPGGAGPSGGSGVDGGAGSGGGSGVDGGAGSGGADGGTGAGGSDGSTTSTGGSGAGGPSGAEQQAGGSGATATGADHGAVGGMNGSGGAGGPSGAEQQASSSGAPAQTDGDAGTGAGSASGAEPSTGSSALPKAPALSEDEATGRPRVDTGANAESPAAQGYRDGAPSGAEKSADKSGFARQRVEFALRDAAKDAEKGLESGNDV